MKFIISITDKEYDEIIEESKAKSPADVKNFLKQKYNINNDFSIRVYCDDYEITIREEGDEE